MLRGRDEPPCASPDASHGTGSVAFMTSRRTAGVLSGPDRVHIVAAEHEGRLHWVLEGL